MTNEDIRETAIVELGLSIDDFNNTTWGNFARLCLRKKLKEIHELRYLRMILSSVLHKDPRELIPLPGDYDHLEARTKEEVEDIARKFGVENWIKRN